MGECLTSTNTGSDLGDHVEKPVTNYPSHGTGCPRHNKLFQISIKTQFVPNGKHNLNCKDHTLNVAYKTNCWLLSITQSI
jgi:hypothetical protein